MKARGSFVALALAAACLPGAATSWAAGEDVTASSAVVSRDFQLEAGVLAEINRTRARAGLKRLRLSKPLSKAAAFHSSEMASYGYFDHASPGGGQFHNRIRRFYRPKRYWAVGENLAWASWFEPAEIVAAWLESPSHRATLLSRLWREVGLGAIAVPVAPGVYGGTDVTILTADFGARR